MHLVSGSGESGAGVRPERLRPEERPLGSLLQVQDPQEGGAPSAGEVSLISLAH